MVGASSFGSVSSSCSSGSVLDAVRFKELGLPAAAIVTEPFTTTGKVMAELQGFADYPFATVPHPIGSLSEDQVTALADAVTPAVESLLLRGEAGPVAPLVPNRGASTRCWSPLP